MKLPLVSICMPAYNVERYISESIESVKAQTYANWELIIVDDGSTDRTRSVALGYATDPRIHVYSQTNGGQCNASNTAYNKSSGSFIKFLDADDLIDPLYLESMVRRTAGDKVMLFSHCCNFKNTIADRIDYEIGNWITMSPVEFLLDSASNMRQGGRWLIPRKVIEIGGLWDESLTLINDYEYFTRLSLAADSIAYVPEAVLFYRQVENSLSAQKSHAAYQSAFRAIQLGGEQLIARENSLRVRRKIANAFQDVLYRMYPSYPDLVEIIEKQIASLGGADIPLGGGNVTLLLNRVLGWKRTSEIKSVFRRKSLR